ncbi:MAG: hypothetical protein EZS28_007039 [Streblomastix strix]|uniref:Uncharacterized protein n=1 Tax=Streblomastix strix TaxID=222440 RepID=A0A5J4WSP0_9EUKA|nr:MAG: hypothetical protein EZS28_007039 [Streblomastix strix]
MTTIYTNQIRVHKSKHASVIKKELSEEDKARLQAIDDAITNSFRKAVQIPPLQISRDQLQHTFSHKLSNAAQTPIQSREFNIDEQEEFQRGIQTDRPRREYNIHKYKEVPRETAQVEPEQVVKDAYLSHSNLEVQKHIIYTIWRCVDSRKKGEDFIFNSDNYIKLWALITQEEEKDIEVVMEEPLMRNNSCTSKKCKKKEIVRVDDVLIKNVSISNIDNVLLNSIEKLYGVNKDFVRLSVKLESEIACDEVALPITANRIIKLGGTSNQILLANGDTIDKDKLDYEPIENARYSSIAYRMYEQRIWGTLTTQNSRLEQIKFAMQARRQTASDEYKAKPLTRNSLFLINGNHYIVGAVGSGKPTLLSKLILIYKQRINPLILYFSNFGADETKALNLNSKNLVLTNITYEEAKFFLPNFDEIKYMVKEIYTYWKLREVNIPYKSDFIQRMKERILVTNLIKEITASLRSSQVPCAQLKESQKDYVKRIADLFQQECIYTIIKYSVPTKIMRFIIPAMIHNVQFEKKLKIVPQNTQADAELKVIKIPILFHSSLLNSLLIFDDIGSNADIQRFSSGLARTITHLVSDSRHSKNTVFFIAQRPSYLFKTARILSHVKQNSANGDFAFSAQSGIVWMYDAAWYNSGDIVPDQVTPASDANPLVDSGTGVVGTSTQYSRGDHQHPLQVSTILPAKDTSVGTVGQAIIYARSDHQHPIQTVDTIPNSDSADESYGTVESYARNDHSHPINVQTNASIVPIDNGVGNNGTSAYYSRHDHDHPQQLTYDGNVTATQFIKSGGSANDILPAYGTTKKLIFYIMGQELQAMENYGCDPNAISGAIANQWSIYKKGDGSLNIVRTTDQNTANKGLKIRADGSILTFNGSVIAGTGATNGATNGSVNYSAGNPILWDVNSVDPIGGFYSDGAKVYWRAKTLTIGSIPQ